MKRVNALFVIVLFALALSACASGLQRNENRTENSGPMVRITNNNWSTAKIYVSPPSTRTEMKLTEVGMGQTVTVPLRGMVRPEEGFIVTVRLFASREYVTFTVNPFARDQTVVIIVQSYLPGSYPSVINN